MKTSISPLLFAVLLCIVLTACSPQQNPHALPSTRPADFELNLKEFGGPNDPSNTYGIGRTESFLTERDGIVKNTWVFRTDPVAFDSLYATLHALALETITMVEEPASTKDRFGYVLGFKLPETTLEVRDQGQSYIQQEEEYDRFLSGLAAIREFVGIGLAAQMYAAHVDLYVDLGEAKLEALQVDLEASNLIELPQNPSALDTLWGEKKVLRGIYALHAFATIDQKDFEWKGNIDLMEGPKTIVLALSPTGFLQK